ncbi:MAG: hypothetical protein ACRED5_03405 [Propylenella sp.]
MTEDRERRPYPGLRSFTREETALFFGREHAVDEIVGRLGSTRFLAVLGPSGSGKSSLVRGGLIHALESGFLQRARSDWRIVDFRPGAHPFLSLAEALLRAKAGEPVAAIEEEAAGQLASQLSDSPRSLVEWCRAGSLPGRFSLLLFVDQFEELFREDAPRAEAEAFVATLLASAAVPLEEARIYVAIAMRSEFLGAAALVDGLAEAIDKGRFLTPRLSRGELRKAIVGPAQVCGFEVEDALADRLLDDLAALSPAEDADAGDPLGRLARRADQLPLLQHVMSMLWSTASARGGDAPVLLTRADYEAAGGVGGAISRHGRDILEELLPEHRSVAPSVFRALVAGSSLADAVGRPTAFGDLVEIAHGEDIAVREIVETFRAPGRDFLTPPRPEPLRAATLIGITHESLIRQWDAFALWLRDEVAAAAAWRRLADHAERHRRGETDLIYGAALTSLADWWDREQPTALWAMRYGGDYRLAKTFLEESRRADATASDSVAGRQKQGARNRLLAFAAVVTVCIVAPLTVFAGYTALRANEEAAHAREQAAAAVEARGVAAEQRQAAEAAWQQAEAERARAEEERKLAAAAEQRAEEELASTLAARADAEAAKSLAAQESDRAEEERRRALEAIEQATAAGLARDRADEERRAAVVAREAAEQTAQRAEIAAAEADAERDRALASELDAVARAEASETARQAAVEQAAAAVASRDQAHEELRQAVAARVAAEQIAEAANAKAAEAEQARLLALPAQQDAMARAETAEAERQAAIKQATDAEQERNRAAEERGQAIAAREAAELTAERAESDAALAYEAGLRAFAARQEAEERAAAADEARRAAEEQAARAETARAEAEQAAKRAEELADQERLRALAAIDQAKAAEADLRRTNEELARARAALEVAQAEKEQAEVERRRALAAQSQAPNPASEAQSPLAE